LQPQFSIDLGRILSTVLMFIGIGLALALLLAGWVIWRVRRINLPPDADFFVALRATPFVVVLLLDLLDFSLDIFSAPFAWVLLTRLGLAPLRTVTVIEDLIPGTQIIPTMTIAWVLARVVRTRSVL
jgi:hypothetical protein